MKLSAIASDPGHFRMWHELPVRGDAAIPSGYRGTFSVPAAPPARVFMTL